MRSSFDYFEQQFPSITNFGRLAESYAEDDPSASIWKSGLIAESIVSMIYKYDHIPEPADRTAVTRINFLKWKKLLPNDIANLLHNVRRARNKAAHTGEGTTQNAKIILPAIYSLSVWFANTYGNFQDPFPKYQPPAAPPTEQLQALEAKEEELAKHDEIRAEQAPTVAKSDRVKRSESANNQRPRSEEETRLIIDAQLTQVGWEADTDNFRYSKGTRPQKGRNLAIAEWPTDSKVGRNGRADYALFVGEELVGIIEAKAESENILSVLDYQAKDYACQIRKEDQHYTIGRWGDFFVPFIFATNGRPYLKQFETKSGIWFRDVREPENNPYALPGWPRPDGLIAKLAHDKKAAEKKLTSFSDQMLTDPNGLNLRNYQVDAIHAAEDAVDSGKTTALLAMATGTGKTRTVLGMIYRFLKSGRFRRILFLVDRNALGVQATDAFKDVKLEELMTLDELYNVQGLGVSDFEKETKVRVSTVQSMVRQVFYSGGSPCPAVTDYDLIIVDEAHRGYLLDKEMTTEEAQYRDQYEYQSAYRSLIEYFDAVKIALTATPALHTTEIFGQPVYTYSYREAVMDGWLVDHDAPHRLTTQLSTEGIQFGKGETLPLFDVATGEITNSEQLKDEVNFEIEQFNKQVITKEFNRTVLEEIAQDLDPSSPEETGKTLIYAVDDSHADMIVDLLKEIFSSMGVDSDAIMKITGSVAGGNRRKIEEAIRRFKNESYPSIVVTVDLLTTGIDVPAITTLVFLRRVKSRILFEQMLGRASRLCPQIGKEKFEIYDPVGVYEALEAINTMKPVVSNPNTRFADLVEGIDNASDENSVKAIIDEVIAKIQRKKTHITGKVADQVQELSGLESVDKMVETLKGSRPADAAAWVKDHGELFNYLDETNFGKPRKLVISHKEDKLLEHTRDYGKADNPKDYLDEFTQFLATHREDIAILKTICTRPSDLTREELKSFKLLLDREGFTEAQLSRAVSQMSNQEITADIISLVRRYSIGSPLVSHQERVRRAVEKIKNHHSLNKIQLGWLDRIEQYLENELIISPQTLDSDNRFRQRGGLKKANLVFGDRVDEIIDELNTYLYEDQEDQKEIA